MATLVAFGMTIACDFMHPDGETLHKGVVHAARLPV